MTRFVEKRQLNNKYFGRGPSEFMKSILDSMSEKEIKEIKIIIDKLINKFTVDDKFNSKKCAREVIKIINKKRNKKLFKSEHVDKFEKDLQNAKNEEQRKAVLFFIIGPFFIEKFFSN